MRAVTSSTPYPTCFTPAIHEIQRVSKPGDPQAAIDPLSDPAVRAAVANATFEHLVGFQLTQEQIRYNATR